MNLIFQSEACLLQVVIPIELSDKTVETFGRYLEFRSRKDIIKIKRSCMQTFHHFLISRRDKCHDENKYHYPANAFVASQKLLWFAYDLRFQFKSFLYANIFQYP